MRDAIINQKRIAEHLNLSPATVSRSLRNDTSIHPATRAKVIEAAGKLGYQLRASSRATTAFSESQQIISLGVFIGHPAGFRGDPSTAGQEMLAGLSDAAAQKNVAVATHFVPPDEAENILDPVSQPAAMRAGRLSGLILLYPFPERTVRILCTRLPCVSIVHHYQPEMNVDCVDTDQTHAVARLVAHLHGLGHRRIGFLAWGHGVSWERRRFHGYVQGLVDCGLALDRTLVLNLDGTALDEEQEAGMVLRMADQGVKAWVCAADHVGYHLCRQLQRQGLVIGRDVSVTGYDGMYPPPDCPALTTIHVPFQEMGYAALRRLLYRIREPAAMVRDVLLRCEFVKGQTTGPPA